MAAIERKGKDGLWSSSPADFLHHSVSVGGCVDVHCTAIIHLLCKQKQRVKFEMLQ